MNIRTLFVLSRSKLRWLVYDRQADKVFERLSV